MRKKKQPTPEALRFWRHVLKTDSCWIWTGGRFTRNHYGCFTLKDPRNGSKAIPAHRFSWELHFGQIEPGMVIHHICHNGICVNPLHLQKMGLLAHRELHRRPYCKYGHPMTGDNLMYQKRGNGKFRRCRACRRESNKRWKLRRC